MKKLTTILLVIVACYGCEKKEVKPVKPPIDNSTLKDKKVM